MNVLITGSSSGFGKLTVEALAAKGHTVFATMRNVNGKNENTARSLRDWAKDKGFDVEVVELDVTNQASVDAAVKGILDSGKHIDVVINNAGIGGGGLLEGYTVEQVQDLYDINVFGPLRVDRAVLPHMRERKQGTLIYISSILGRVLLPFLGHYPATKFALEAYAGTLAMEAKHFGIDVVIVEPGAYPTDFHTRMLTPADDAVLGSYGEVAKIPEKIFAAFGEFMQSDAAPDPAEVPMAILDIIDTPPGKRPLRVVADKVGGEAIRKLNDATATAQDAFQTAMGMKQD